MFILRVALLCLAFSLLSSCSPANASPPIGEAVAISQALPAAGPGHSDGFLVNCIDDDETPIYAPTQVSYECRVAADAAAVVWVGDSDVANDGSAGGVYYEAGDRFGGDIKIEYCIAASGTVVVYCRAMVTSAP